jgi:aryl-alcohol dehydrogenase-like predicted oxidoreductase
MEKRRIGSLEVSVVGLGCNNFGWRIDADASKRVIHAALDAGITFFDTADVYGDGRSEKYVGDTLWGRRDDVVIATKFGWKVGEHREGASPKYVKTAVEQSLRRLRIDTIDLYQLHKPDPSVPIEETLGAMNELIRAGKVREIGCSNFSGEQIRSADAAGQGLESRFVSVQNEYSLMHRQPEAEVLPECGRLGLAFLPYFPLASGLLTGKYQRNQPFPPGSRGDNAWGPKVFTEQNIAIVERLTEFAEGRGYTVLELAFSWLASQPSVASVIAGATSPGQVLANSSAADWTLSESDLAQVDAIVQPVRDSAETSSASR